MPADPPSLQGIVCYTLQPNTSGKEAISAKFISDRISSQSLTGTGKATRTDDGTTGFEGRWLVEYYDPSGKLAWCPFGLRLERRGEVYHGTWARTTGEYLLSGFGFEQDGKLYMRYGT